MKIYKFRLGLSAFIIMMGALFFVSCKKNKEIKMLFSGNISDSNRNVKVNEAEVKIYSKVVENGSFSNTYKLITSTITDVNGSYSFEFTRENVIDYKLVVTKNNYFDYEKIISPDDLSTDHGNVYNIDCIPKSWIRLHIINNNPINSEDQITFSYFENTYNCPSCCGTSPLTLKGELIDTTFKCVTWSNKSIGYQTLVTKIGNSVLKKANTYMPFGDTAFVEISY